MSKKTEKFKKCESLLFLYPEIPIRIDIYNSIIEAINNKKGNEGFTEEEMKKQQLCNYKIKELEYIQRQISIILKRLTTREQKLIEARYFINGDNSWKTVGQKIGLCGDRAAIIRDKTINEICKYLFIDEV